MDGVDDTSAQLSGTVRDLESNPSFLAVIIDLHADSWAEHSPHSLWDVLSRLLVFMNAHLALHCSNELAVLGYSSIGAKFLHSTAMPVDPNHGDASRNGRVADGEENYISPTLEGTMIKQFKNLDTKVIEVVRAQIEMAQEEQCRSRTSVAGPLTLALTYLNRKMQQLGTRGHILIVSASPDNVGSKYIPSMNSIFTAQKLGIPIDSAVVGSSNSFLQQAADFTDGSYLEITSLDVLLQSLISVFLIEPGVRPFVNLATKPDVNFSAVCFLTREVVEIGLVCSVCLCITAKMPENKQCPVCKTKYEV